MLDHLAVFASELDCQLAFAGKPEVRCLVLVAKGMTADNDRLGPAGNEARNVADDDRLAENDATQNVADRAVRRFPHFLQVEFRHPVFVRRDGGAFDANTVFGNRIGRVDGDLVVGRIAAFDTKIIIFKIDVQIGMDQLVLDELPDDSGHFVAIEFNDRVLDLDFRHICLFLERLRDPRRDFERIMLVS